MSPTTVLHLKSDTQKFGRRLKTGNKIENLFVQKVRFTFQFEAKIFFNFQLIKEDEHLNFMFTLMSFILPKHL